MLSEQKQDFGEKYRNQRKIKSLKTSYSETSASFILL